MPPKLKQLLIMFLKFAVAFTLVYWMIATDKLHFSEIKIFINHPEITLFCIFLWLVGFALLGSLRWFLLLRGLNLEVAFFRTFQMQLIGFFFNSVMPSAVGGDIIKGVYIVRDSQKGEKTSAALTILLDRIIGLVGLFTLGGITLAFNLREVLQHEVIKSLVIIIYAFLLASVLLFLAIFIDYRHHRDPFIRFFSLGLPGFKILEKIYKALRCYKERPFFLITAWLISVVIMVINMAFFISITKILTGASINLPIYAAIFPIAILTTALPIAPAGLGIGHVAFERLYDLVGMSNGANVFNIFFLGIIVLNMIGFIPYLFFRKIKLDTSKTNH